MKDVFLSYSTPDHALAEHIHAALAQRGISGFLDRRSLVPGLPWPQELEKALSNCRSVAVLLGPGPMGNWQQRERDLALHRQTPDNNFRVIPVLLPGADPALGFMGSHTWVDLREDIDDDETLNILAAAIRGESPESVRAHSAHVSARVCPYRGLDVFREEDAPFFFGRDAVTDQLHQKVVEDNFVAVVGPSGGGKSSVVRAGLIPILRQPGGDAVWEAVTMVPGADPFKAFAAALMPHLEPTLSETDRLFEINKMAEGLAGSKITPADVTRRVLEKQPGTDRVLLLVDQWEELYTHRPDGREEKRVYANHVRRFIDGLLHGARDKSVTVVMTLRADFYASAIEHRELGQALMQRQVNLVPMTSEELEQAITRPARRTELQFEPGLVKRLLADVGEEPGNLALMEFALRALWDDKDSHMRHDTYEEMGGVKGAIAQHAEQIYGQLDEAQGGMMPGVLLRLVSPGGETGDTRRRAPMDAFDEDEKLLLRHLAGPGARLLVLGRNPASEQATVEVAHEALVREWPRLRQWIDEQREALRLSEAVRSAVGVWVNAGRDDRLRWPDEVLQPARQSLRQAGLLTSLEADNETTAFLTSECGSLLEQIADGATAHARRLEIGLRLAEIGDIRPGVGVSGGIPEIRWCRIGAGEVSLQGRSFSVEPFRMAKYSVTNAQFQAFVIAEDGYTSDRWWQDLDVPSAHRQPQPPRWGLPNHPRESVSWFEAMAFCVWLSERMGLEVRLPSEWEYERAARGENDRTYPWGDAWQDECANTRESRIGTTTAVGVFPDGASPEGVMDLAGNVWEWCLNERQYPDKTQRLVSGSRVLRGGSWYGVRASARAAGRIHLNPDGRNDRVGFRLVCSSPIPD